MAPITARVRDRGEITLPPVIRRRLNLKKGDRVSFVETDNGVLIKSAHEIVDEGLAEIGASLTAKGITLEEMIERGRVIRESIIAEEYGLTEPKP
jgi:AbrB family looped-hinge helix DNA binding protein